VWGVQLQSVLTFGGHRLCRNLKPPHTAANVWSAAERRAPQLGGCICGLGPGWGEASGPRQGSL
jgi:hypothetical protein